jgi:hypothetical protein
LTRELRRRQLVVEDDDVDARFGGGGGEHLDLPLAEERGGIRLGALLLHAQHDLGVRRIGESGPLFERVLGIEMSRRVLEETDECRPLFHQRSAPAATRRVPSGASLRLAPLRGRFAGRSIPLASCRSMLF